MKRNNALRRVRLARDVVGKLHKEANPHWGSIVRVEYLHSCRQPAVMSHCAFPFRFAKRTLVLVPLGAQIFAGGADFLGQGEFGFQKPHLLRAKSPERADSRCCAVVEKWSAALVKQQYGWIIVSALRRCGVCCPLGFEAAYPLSSDVEMGIHVLHKGNLLIASFAGQIAD
jgi:hypothetical protein